MFFIVLSSHPFGFSRSVRLILPLLLGFVFRRLLFRFQRLSDVLGCLVGLSLGVDGDLCFVSLGRLCLVFKCIGISKAEIIFSCFFVQRNIPFVRLSFSVYEIRHINSFALRELFVLFIGERFATVVFRVLFLCLLGCFVTKKVLWIFFVGVELYIGVVVRTVFKIQPLQINGFPVFQILFLVFGQLYALNLIGYFYPFLSECDNLVR